MPFSLPSELRSRLKVIALGCLLATAIMALVVAHGRAPYAFENPALAWLGLPFAVRSWADVATFLAAPVVAGVLVVSLALGLLRRAFFRVAFYTTLAAAALLISEHVAKPLVQRTYYGELTFPSGSVTAVSATALAMWLALYPLLGKRARSIVLGLGLTWTLLMSAAVVGAHWHTPLDTVGSLLLSVGVVSAGAVAFESVRTRRPVGGAARTRSRER
jgi:hypothetical protein